jgi:predicted solute-binding protein
MRQPASKIQQTRPEKSGRSRVNDCLDMWNWWRKRTSLEGFPKGFKVLRIAITAAKNISDLPSSEIAKYFYEHPEIAKDLLGESYDKRFTPPN